MTRTALVIGATGGLGSETALALAGRGWRVRAMNRNPEAAARGASWLGPVEWVKGDAMNAADVIAAAKGADLIVHAVNPPGYRNWKKLALPMLESTIAAAAVSGARIVFPGSVYNFGPGAFPLLNEQSPQNPQTRKGVIRLAMETRLREAAGEGVRTLVLRAGDFFGPHGGNNWFGQCLVRPGRRLRSVTYPGAHEAGHAWAFLPDLAETIARLVEREDGLPAFEVFHFGGHWFEHGGDMADAIRRAAGMPGAPLRRFPWAGVYLASPFVTMFRELIEMRYLWKIPVRLDNARLVAFLGEEPHTPLDRALRMTLRGLGCLDADAESTKFAAASLEGRM